MWNVAFLRVEIVTAQRSLLREESINALRSTTDGLKAFDNKPLLVPFTKDFIEIGRCAHANYARRIEEDKMNKEQAKKETAAKIAAIKERELLQKELG